ncbi:MAG: hypothetical protein O8C65_12195 [Candidatus Methanoperedens sp.]|nr:hypothetical protein [Candidatus Methanoperedens sp.]
MALPYAYAESRTRRVSERCIHVWLRHTCHTTQICCAGSVKEQHGLAAGCASGGARRGLGFGERGAQEVSMDITAKNAKIAKIDGLILY